MATPKKRKGSVPAPKDLPAARNSSPDVVFKKAFLTLALGIGDIQGFKAEPGVADVTSSLGQTRRVRSAARGRTSADGKTSSRLPYRGYSRHTVESKCDHT